MKVLVVLASAVIIFGCAVDTYQSNPLGGSEKDDPREKHLKELREQKLQQKLQKQRDFHKHPSCRYESPPNTPQSDRELSPEDCSRLYQTP